MRAFMLTLTLSIAGLMLAAPAVSQEGHPAKGSWIGSWAPNGGSNARLLIVMDWDGESIVGTINPGRNAMPIENASLDPENWTMRIEATDGEGTNYVLEGQIQGLAFHNRQLVGTWSSQGERGTFEIARQ